MKKYLSLLFLLVCLIIPLKVAASSEVERDLSIEYSMGDNYDAEPMYLRSYWWYGSLDISKGDVIFYQDYNGFRGYVSRQDNNYFNYQGVIMARYAGTLYHPSVKNIPALSEEETPVLLSDDSVLTGINSKYVKVSRTYPYDFAKYGTDLIGIPLRIFYNDGVYKGYLSYTANLPVDIGKNTVTMTYAGTVYSGGYYPAVGNEVITEVE